MKKGSKEYKAYLRAYVAVQKEERKTAAVRQLGGQCRYCGSKDNLEFDHINPKTKTSSVSGLWRATEEKFWSEVRKCQLLCKPCHENKSKAEAANRVVVEHGTLNAFQRHGCRCRECQTAAQSYKRDWRQRRKEQGLRPS